MGQSISTDRRAISELRRAAELKMLNDDFMEAEIVLKNLQLAQESAVKYLQDFAVPIAPLIMGLGYRYDCAFGTNHELVRDKAEAMLRKNDERLKMIGGPLTLNEVDAYRERHFQ
ncbi:hypothetical protein OSTOST_26124 [Ostertagia ostertagi]